MHPKDRSFPLPRILNVAQSRCDLSIGRIIWIAWLPCLRIAVNRCNGTSLIDDSLFSAGFNHPLVIEIKSCVPLHNNTSIIFMFLTLLIPLVHRLNDLHSPQKYRLPSFGSRGRFAPNSFLTYICCNPLFLE